MSGMLLMSVACAMQHLHKTALNRLMFISIES